jgi:hypothetical protein
MYIKCADNISRFPASIALVSKESATSVDAISLCQKIVTLPRDLINRLFALGYEQT